MIRDTEREREKQKEKSTVTHACKRDVEKDWRRGSPGESRLSEESEKERDGWRVFLVRAFCKARRGSPGCRIEKSLAICLFLVWKRAKDDA